MEIKLTIDHQNDWSMVVNVLMSIEKTTVVVISC